jgi:hypothetical protein
MILGIAHLVAEARVEAWRASVEAGSPSQLERLLSLREERGTPLRVDWQACRIDVTGAHLRSKLFAGRLAPASVRRV